ALSGFNNINLYGVSLKNIISIILVIYLSHNYGILIGLGGSIVVGMVSYISHTEMPFIISIFAVGGLLAGLFRDLGKSGSILGFLLGNGIVSFYINNFGTSFLDYKELLVSSIGFLIVSKYININVESFLSESFELKKDYNSKKDKITINKLNNASQLLNSISNILNKSVKSQKEFSPSRVYDLIDEVSTKACKSCF